MRNQNEVNSTPKGNMTVAFSYILISEWLLFDIHIKSKIYYVLILLPGEKYVLIKTIRINWWIVEWKLLDNCNSKSRK